MGAAEISDELDEAAYALELMISAVLTTNIFQFGYWRCRARPGNLSHWQRWDAAYYLGVAVPLNVAFPLAVVLIYIGHVNYPDSKMWRGSWFPNTPHGIILYLGKWFGTIVLTIGVVKVTQIHRKIARKWREIRRASDGLPSTTGTSRVTQVKAAETIDP